MAIIYVDVVRPESMESAQEKITGRPFKQCSQGPQKRKKRLPAASKSTNINMDNNIGDGNEQDSEVVRPESMQGVQEKVTGRRFKQCSQGPQKRKKRWPAASKSANINKDNIVPTVPYGDGRKKHARVRGVRGSSMKRTPEVPGEYPSYTRCMEKSNVVTVFWLHISTEFCRRYLPKNNTVMTLEDEDGQRYHVRYISGSYGLSGRWKKFAVEHNLKVGDTVVFQLVKPTEFKVYIKREKEFTTTDDDVRSKEVTTKASSAAVGDYANNLVREEAVDGIDCTRSPYPDKEDLEGMPSFKGLNIEKGRATEKMRALKSKIATLNSDLEAMEIEMAEMESSANKIAQAMQRIATAPW